MKPEAEHAAHVVYGAYVAKYRLSGTGVAHEQSTREGRKETGKHNGCALALGGDGSDGVAHSWASAGHQRAFGLPRLRYVNSGPRLNQRNG